MTRHPTTLLATAAAAAAVASTMGVRPAPSLVWNASESVAIGLYRVQRPIRPTVSDLVVVYPPEPLATLLAARGYLPRHVPLVKPILAIEGQSVCREDLRITVNGIEMGLAREHDGRGRVLPVWQGCRVVAKDEIFLMNRDQPASLDGRYFGPIPATAIVGRAKPLWTFAGQGTRPRIGQW